MLAVEPKPYSALTNIFATPEKLASPSNPWTGEQLCKHFCSLTTTCALVEEDFCFSGNLEAGADINDAYGFDGIFED